MRHQKVSTLVFTLLCAGALLLTGCAGGAPQVVAPTAALTLEPKASSDAAPPTTAPAVAAMPAADEPLIARVAADAPALTDLDPASACVSQHWILGNVYETLTRYNLPGEEPFVLPGLATGWEASADGKTWTFHLREGVKFHDGSDFNAEAVKFTVERNKELNMCSAYIYIAVDSIETPDPLTVVFHLSRPAPMDAILASNYNAWMMSPAAVKSNDAAWFAAGNDAGTGPYRMANYEPGQRMTLERFDDYWGGWEPGQFDKVLFELVTDMTAAEQMLRAGQLDFATSRALTPEQMLSLDAEESLALLDAPGYGNWYIYLDHRRAPTDNILVRQALAYSFPYEAVLENTNLGRATRAHGPVPVTVWGQDPEPPPYSHDLEKAKELLDQAGYRGGMEFAMTFDPEEQTMAELWQAELAKINVKLNLAPLDFSTRWEIANSGSPDAPQAFTTFWGPDVVGPYTYLAPFHSEVMPDFNMSHYADEAYNALIDDADLLAVTDKEAAIGKFMTAQRMLRDDAAAIFIADKHDLSVIAEDLVGYTPNPAYGFTVPWYDVRRVE